MLGSLFDKIRTLAGRPRLAGGSPRPPVRAHRALTKIYLEPTTRCNLQCRTCMRHSWSEPGGDLSLSSYRQLLAGLGALDSLRTLAFWGIGEPLLHPRILQLVRLARQQGLLTEMVTNGMLLDQAMAVGLVDAGLDRLVVSVDGTTPKSFARVREGGGLEQLRQNLGRLVQAIFDSGAPGPDIGVEFVLMRRNLEELPRLPALARELGASHIILTNLLPYAAELKDEILYWLCAADTYSAARFGDTGDGAGGISVQLPKVDAHPEYLHYLQQLGRPIIGDGRHLLAQPDADGRCPFAEEGSAAVAWDGSVSPCVALMHDHTCHVLGRKKNVRHYALGNIQQQSLAQIWRGDEFARFRERMLEFNFSPCVACGGCDLVEANEEDCFGNFHPTCGDCLWARGVIVCP